MKNQLLAVFLLLFTYLCQAQVGPISITCADPVIKCGINTHVILEASTIYPNVTYQWRYDSFNTNLGANFNIIGATSSTLIATRVGNYVLVINDGINSIVSSSIFVSNDYAFGTLKNSSGNMADEIITIPGTTRNLIVDFTGSGPWEIELKSGGYLDNSTLISTNTSPLLIPITPLANEYFKITTKSQCGISSNSNEIVAKVGTTPILNLPTPIITTVCQGGIIEIPYLLTGTIGNIETFVVSLVDVQYNSLILESPINEVTNTNPVKYFISQNVPVGNYKMDFLLKTPYLSYPSNKVISSYNISVTNSNCSSPPIPRIESKNESCNGIRMEASFNNYFGSTYSAGYQFKWFKNDNEIIGETKGVYWATESGSYKVNVSLSSIGYIYTSLPKVVTVNRVIPPISSPNTILCGTNSTSTLSTSFTGAGYNYQWYQDRILSDGTSKFMPIFGANQSSTVVNTPGKYAILVDDGSCQHNSITFLSLTTYTPIYTTPFIVTATATTTLTNTSGTNTAIIRAPNDPPSTIRANLTGTGPWNFDLVDSGGNRFPKTSNSATYDIAVTPTQSTLYHIENLVSLCGAGTASGTVEVIVSPTPSLIINNPGAKIAATNVCAGSTFSIAFTTIGNWSATDRDLVVELVNPSTGESIAGSLQKGYNTNPILYFVPYNTPVGSYKVKLTAQKPYIESAVLSDYSVTIGSTDCILPRATIRVETNCSNSILSATPSGTGFTYQWLKEGIAINNGTSSTYNATVPGNYTVNIQNTGNGFNETSITFSLAINEISGNITALGQVCDNVGITNFTSSNSGSGFSHQWYFSENNGLFTPVPNAINNTFTASSTGYYYDIVKSGDCELKSNTLNTCKLLLNFSSKTVCKSSSVTVPFTYSGGDNHLISFDLLDATNNSVVLANIATLTSNLSSSYTPTITLPSNLTLGTYKFKINIGSPSNNSKISDGILTINNVVSGTAPSIITNTNSITSAQNVTLTAYGCNGAINWQASDNSIFETPAITKFIDKTSVFKAKCTDLLTGCVSPEASFTINYNCGDAYEPNDLFSVATPIASDNFTSPIICLNGSTNADWFSWVNNGKTYYIKVSLKSGAVPAGNYKLKLVNGAAGAKVTSTTLTVETLPEIVGQNLDTYISIFDTDGITLLSANDNGNANGFSKASYVIGGALPISLIDFFVKQIESTIQLTWKTAQETNFSHFEIQKSSTNKEFGTIGKIMGNQTATYNFTDTNPTEGQNYYKLKMVDLDGTSSFSKTIAVNFEKNGYYLSVENPVKEGEFTVRSNFENPKFSMVNSLGKKIEIFDRKRDDNLYKISIKNITSGLYFLLTESKGKIITRKILIE
jgi:hypothetical protein